MTDQTTTPLADALAGVDATMSTEPEHLDIDPAKYFQLAAETEAQWPAMWGLLNSLVPGGYRIPVEDTTEQGTGT
jgi:hypothetical protein